MTSQNISRSDFEDALEVCLQGLQAGRDIQTLLEGYPALAEDLRPLLVTALKAQKLHVDNIPAGAQQRSRTQVLGRAAQLRSERSPFSLIFRPRAVSALLILAAVFLASVFSFNAVSAAALPGDQLYPIKRSFENLWLQVALTGSVRNNLERAYQQRRIDEVQELLTLGRDERIVFSGVLTEKTQLPDSQGELWLVSDIPVLVTTETRISGAPQIGWLIEVEGATRTSEEASPINGLVVIASGVRAREYAFTGIVEQINTEFWVISGLSFQITSLTQVDLGIIIGDAVVVLVEFDENNNPFARAILKTQGEPADQTSTASATLAPSPTLTLTPSPIVTEDDGDPDETDEPDETDVPDETQEPDDTDQPDETDEPDETEEPDETDEPDPTDEPDETKEPDDTDEPDETEEP